MSGSDACCAPKEKPTNPAARRVLWIALILNFAMFVIEGASSFRAGSTSLKADAVDFLGDSANYVITLIVFEMGLRARWIAALIKAGCMGLIGIGVIGAALYRVFYGIVPDAPVMGTVGLAALAINAFVALLLYRFRNEDINMQSAWLCSFNDALGNIAVLAAAAGVWFTQTRWPDLAVASVISGLNLWGTYKVAKRLIAEKENALMSGSVDSCCT